jgi:hypothetical protein
VTRREVRLMSERGSMVPREELDQHLSTTDSGRPESRIMPRRCFIRSGMLAAAAAVLLRGSPILDSLTAGAQTSGADLVHDTLNGLIAFVVPGPNMYSFAQGVSTEEATAIILACGSGPKLAISLIAKHAYYERRVDIIGSRCSWGSQPSQHI